MEEFAKYMTANRDLQATSIHLTTQEMRVLALVAKAKSDKQIANDLDISPKTLASHLTAIYLKFDLHQFCGNSRVALLVKAARLGLVDLAP